MKEPRSNFVSPLEARIHPAAVSRRHFILRAGIVVAGLSSLPAIAAACGGDEDGGPTGGGEVSGTINYFGWQGYDDAAALEPLTSQGVKISTEYITTNDDIVTKLQGGGTGNIDVVSPFVGYVPALVAADLIEPLDYGRLENADNFFPEFAGMELGQVDGRPYQAPLVWGDTPMIYRPDLFTDLPDSWLDLRDAKYKGQLLTLDDTYGNIVIIGRALFGPDEANRLTPDMLDDVKNVWIEIKKNIVSLVPSFGDAADIMARGEAGALIQGWRFVQVQLREKGQEAEAHMPSEGSYSWADTLAIAKDAPNENGAYAFIDSSISPEGNAAIGAATGSGVTNQAAVENLPDDQRDLYPYDDIDEFLTVQTTFYALPLEPEPGLTSFDDWLTAWEEVRAA